MYIGSNWLATAGAAISLVDNGDLSDRLPDASGAPAISGTCLNGKRPMGADSKPARRSLELAPQSPWRRVCFSRASLAARSPGDAALLIIRARTMDVVKGF
jgi:hypothetical protein